MEPLSRTSADRPARVGLLALAASVAPVAFVPPLAAQQDEHEHESSSEETLDVRPFTLDLDWPDEGSVRMTVEIQRENGSGSYACTLSWAPEELADRAPEDARPGTIVRYSDFDVLSLNGKTKDEDGFEALANALAPALAAVPPFRVDADGEFDALIELDAAFESAYASLAPGALSTIRALLADPMNRAVIQNSAAEEWAWWGSFWNGYESAPGEAVASEISLPSGLTGTPIEGVLTMECIDRHERDGAEAVHMRARTEYDPDDMLRVTLATLRMTSGEDVPDDAIAGVSRVDEVDGVYLLDGLRPLEVRWSKTFAVDDGTGPRERVERKQWSFVWPE